MINNLQELQTIEQFKRACILLFGKNPQKYFIQAYSKIAKYLSNEILIEKFKENLNLNAKQLSQNFEKPLRTVERWIKELKDKNKIEFKGSPKNGGYDIK